MTGDLSYKQLQAEIGKRLAELRQSVAHGVAPEDVALEAKERGLDIGNKTIRQWEQGDGNPRLSTLCALLTFYGVTLGDFFRFTINSEDGRLIADFVHVIRDPEKRHALKLLIAALRSEQK